MNLIKVIEGLFSNNEKVGYENYYLINPKDYKKYVEPHDFKENYKFVVTELQPEGEITEYQKDKNVKEGSIYGDLVPPPTWFEAKLSSKKGYFLVRYKSTVPSHFLFPAQLTSPEFEIPLIEGLEIGEDWGDFSNTQYVSDWLKKKFENDKKVELNDLIVKKGEVV